MNINAALKNLDKPIQSVEEDLLQRSDFVENLCRIFETASSDVHSPWRMGRRKTSVKNLLVKELPNLGEKAS